MTSLYAVFDVITGRDIGKTSTRHRSKEIVPFLNLIERTRLRTRQIHIILDNSSTHKTQEVRGWRKAPPPLPLPLHAHKLLTAQCRGELVLSA